MGKAMNNLRWSSIMSTAHQRPPRCSKFRAHGACPLTSRNLSKRGLFRSDSTWPVRKWNKRHVTDARRASALDRLTLCVVSDQGEAQGASGGRDERGASDRTLSFSHHHIFEQGHLSLLACLHITDAAITLAYKGRWPITASVQGFTD